VGETVGDGIAEAVGEGVGVVPTSRVAVATTLLLRVRRAATVCVPFAVLAATVKVSENVPLELALYAGMPVADPSNKSCPDELAANPAPSTRTEPPGATVDGTSASRGAAMTVLTRTEPRRATMTTMTAGRPTRPRLRESGGASVGIV